MILRQFDSILIYLTGKTQFENDFKLLLSGSTRKWTVRLKEDDLERN